MIASGNGNRPPAASHDPGQSPHDRETAARRRSRVREGVVAIGVLILAIILGVALRDHDRASPGGVQAAIAQGR